MKKIAYIKDSEKWINEFSYYTTMKVRFSETDMFGHLNNTVPFVYFETARIEFFNHLGFMKDWTNPNSETIPIVADLQCDFINQMYFGEEIKVFVKVETIGKSSVDIHYLGKKSDGSICFTGRGAMVNFNKKTGKGEPWSLEENQLFMARNKVKLNK